MERKGMLPVTSATKKRQQQVFGMDFNALKTKIMLLENKMRKS